MMKKLPIFLTLALLSIADIWAQQTPLTSSYYRNKFLYNPAYSANQIAPRVDILYRQQWGAADDGGLSTTVLTAQMPRLTKKDSTGAVKPILARGLGANVMLMQDKVGLLNTTSFQIGATKSFYSVLDSAMSSPSPISVGFSLGGYMTGLDNSSVIGRADDAVLLQYGNGQFKPDASLGVTYAKDGLQLGFSMRQLFATGKKFEGGNQFENIDATRYFGQYFLTGSYYLVVGTLDRIGIEPQMVVKYNSTSKAQLQFNVVADFWRDWEHGTPRMQAVAGYRTGFGANFGITVRPTPRMAVSYMYELPFGNLAANLKGENRQVNRDGQITANGGLGLLTHEIMITYDLRHEKWTPRPIITLPDRIPDSLNVDSGNDAASIDSLVLEGIVYKKGELINDFLGQVTFEPGTAELKDESYLALDKLAEMMLINKAVRIEVGSHTDSLSNDFSLQLTQKRSDAIRSYLQDVKGVELGRVVPVGFGRTRQQEGKEPERTEFKLIAINEDDE